MSRSQLLIMLLTAAGVLGVPAPAAANCPAGAPDCHQPVDRPEQDVASFTWELATLGTRTTGAVVMPDSDFTDESPTSPVTLNACGSAAVRGIRRYEWTFGNGAPAISTTSCLVTWRRSLSRTTQVVPVTLTIMPKGGPGRSVTHDVRYSDVVIASVGDSAAAGQGAPDDGATFSLSRYCYRSGWAASAQAALRVQRTLGTEVSVHFWFLACSGARISADGNTIWGLAAPDAGGMLDPFTGIDHRRHDPPFEPQVDRLRRFTQQSGLPIDALLMTVGANDTGWATVLSHCLPFVPLVPAQRLCLDTWSERVDASLRRLPAHFAWLADRLGAVVPADRIYLTDYWDPIDGLRDPIQAGGCGGELLAGSYLRGWAIHRVENPLQDAVRDAAAAHRWHYLAGIRQLFQGHGVCRLRDRWINSASDSLGAQLDVNGTWHANRTGQLRMADLITPVLQSAVDSSTRVR
jgi:hypothetical protein